MRARLLPALLALLLLGGCGERTIERPTPAPSEPVPAETATPTPEPDPIRERVEAMGTAEKVGQLLVVGIQGTAPGEDAGWAIGEARVGGVILFGRNVESAGQLVALTNALKEQNQRAGNPPLLLCVDEEGGSVSRMPPEVYDLPSAYDDAQGGESLYDRGRALAAACAAFGFNLDFAPVLDVWSDPNNTVIGRRALSADGDEAAELGAELVRGLTDGGIVAVGKHFPGHGDTAVDSHTGLPVVDKSREELERTELVPFRAAMDAGVPALMAGHLLLPQIDPERPASLSPALIGGLLRGELGFDGVVCTDDLTMGAVTGACAVGEAAVLAVEAGCDMVLVCHGWEAQREACAALLEAAEGGRISQERLDESVYRVLTLKAAYAVSDEAVEDPDLETLNALLRGR